MMMIVERFIPHTQYTKHTGRDESTRQTRISSIHRTPMWEESPHKEQAFSKELWKSYNSDFDHFRKHMKQEKWGTFHAEETKDTLDLSQEAQELFWSNETSNIYMERPEGDGEGGRIEDESRKLTRRLVAAKTTLEVQDVLSAAHKNKMDLQMAAAQGDKRAAAIIRRLNRLISRGNRKVRDLNKEQMMLIKQQQAEVKAKEQIAKKLRDELKRAQIERTNRERRYLRDRLEDDEENAPMISGASQAATEAKIMALAQAMASLSSVISGGDDMSFGDSGAELSGSDGGYDAAIAGADVAGEIA
jgi:hypothetical protein